MVSMKRGTLSFFLIIFFFGSAVVLSIWQRFLPTATMSLAGQRLFVQVAEIPSHQYKGLGGRDTVEPYDGMLFSYIRKAHHGIVMRDMEFAIDIIWFDGEKVVDIAPHVQPEPGKVDGEFTVYRPRIPATAVLEVPAGWAQEHMLTIGDTGEIIE